MIGSRAGHESAHALEGNGLALIKSTVDIAEASAERGISVCVTHTGDKQRRRELVLRLRQLPY
jgi:hypothetical protein